MSMRPIFGCTRSRCFCFSFFESSFSWYALRMSVMPVASMNSGSLKGGFSIPRFPCGERLHRQDGHRRSLAVVSISLNLRIYIQTMQKYV